MNQKKLGGSAINCDAFVSNNVSHVLETHRNSGRRVITKPSFETKNNNQESDNNNDRTPSKPVQEDGSILWVRTQQEEARLQQYHVVWLVEQKKQRTRRVSTDLGRDDQTVRELIGKGASDKRRTH